MTAHRWIMHSQVLLTLGMLLALAACGSGTVSQGSNPTSAANTTPSSTATAQATPTLAPPVCDANFTNPAYVTTLPDAPTQPTMVYAQVPMPPLTRSYDDDASGGLRGRHLCSAGTTTSVLAFMTQHLVQLGWQQMDISAAGCTPLGNYGQPQCWKNGQYALSLGINSNTDWFITFLDPSFRA